jgi:hypothetical protein
MTALPTINQNKSRGAIRVAHPACSVFEERCDALLINRRDSARTSRALRRLMRDSVSLEYVRDELNWLARERYNEAPKATYDAVVYELRTYGLPPLSKPNCQRRLADLSIAQFKNLMAGLQRRRGQYPNVSDELLTALATIYDARVTSDER